MGLRVRFDGRRRMRNREAVPHATEFLFDRPSQIDHEMKAVGDLRGLWRATAHALGIRAMTFAADVNYTLKPFSLTFGVLTSFPPVGDRPAVS